MVNYSAYDERAMRDKISEIKGLKNEHFVKIIKILKETYRGSIYIEKNQET